MLIYRTLSFDSDFVPLLPGMQEFFVDIPNSTFRKYAEITTRGANRVRLRNGKNFFYLKSKQYLKRQNSEITIFRCFIAMGMINTLHGETETT